MLFNLKLIIIFSFFFFQKEEFLYAAQQMSQITPLEINILFDLADLLHADGRISLHDIGNWKNNVFDCYFF